MEKKNKRQPERDATDESLRHERQQADEHYDARRDRAEAAADEASRQSRQSTDDAVQAGRAQADRQRPSGIEESEQQQRDDEDELRRQERSRSDAALARERAQGRRYLADFLLLERNATDTALSTERARGDQLEHERNELLATVSHDLRNMLTNLALYPASLVNGMPSGPAADKARRQLAGLHRTLDQMKRLIGDLLDLSIIDDGHLKLVREELDVAAVVRDALETLEPVARAKEITLVADGLDRVHRASVDGGRLMQVMANLLGNAIKFTQTGGTVELWLRSSEDEIEISVTDDGPGIPADQLPRMFAPFEQATLDRRGLGLGLHICKSIVEAHGGRIWAESQKGVGAAFHVGLPRER